MRGGEFIAGPRGPDEGVRMKKIIVATLLLLGLIATPLTAVGKLPPDFDKETEIKKLNADLAAAPTACCRSWCSSSPMPPRPRPTGR